MGSQVDGKADGFHVQRVSSLPGLTITPPPSTVSWAAQLASRAAPPGPPFLRGSGPRGAHDNRSRFHDTQHPILTADWARGIRHSTVEVLGGLTTMIRFHGTAPGTPRAARPWLVIERERPAKASHGGTGE